MQYIEQFPSNGMTQSIHAYIKQMPSVDVRKYEDTIRDLRIENQSLKNEMTLMNESLRRYSDLIHSGGKGFLIRSVKKENYGHDSLISDIILEEIIAMGAGDPRHRNRSKPLKVHPKSIYVWVMTRVSTLSISKMGNILNVDHSTIIHHRQVSNNLYQYDFAFKEIIDILLPKIIQRVNELNKSIDKEGVDTKLLLQQATEN